MMLRRLSLRVDPSDVELASAILSAAANSAIAVYEAAGPLSRPEVSAYVATGDAARATSALAKSIAAARSSGMLRTARRRCASVRSEDWATSWKRFYRPFRIADRLYVAPSWRSDFRPPGHGRVIQLDPGMAFGTGQHATTKMAMKLLLSRVTDGARMIDVGCGSGILGIAAAQRGARVYACDADSIAVEATRDNFAHNELRPVAVKHCTGLPRSFPASPLIVANITAEVLADLAGAFFSKLEAKGVLVTSGVTARGRSAMLRSFAKSGLRLIDESKSGEWLAHVHCKGAE